MEWIIGKEGLIISGITVLAGAFWVLHRLGFVSFKKQEITVPVPTLSSDCPDPGCKATLTEKMEGMKEDIGEMKEHMTRFESNVYAIINQTAKDLSDLNGYIRGKNNGNRETW